MQEGVSPIEYEELGGARAFLRIAAVTETYPPEVNGVATSAARFLEGLRSRGHHIQLVRPRQDRADQGGPESGLEQVLMRGVAIPRYPALRMGLPARRALVRLWSLRRPDVVHIVTEGPLGWSALHAAAKLKLPTVSDFRTNFHAYSSHYGVGWLKKPILAYLRKLHNRTLATMVPTEALRAQLAALSFRGLRVIARGIDTVLFHPARHDLLLLSGRSAAPDDPVLLYVGRLAPEKNLDLLATAYGEARRRTPSARLVVVGDGPGRALLQRWFPDAVFAGTRKGEDLARHFASADVFIFPSMTKSDGNVTLEALASGLAVIAFDYAAAGEVIRHGVDGVLAAYGDAASFISQAATLTGDLERVRRLGCEAHLQAAGRGWGAVVQELETVLVAAAAMLPAVALQGPFQQQDRRAFSPL